MKLFEEKMNSLQVALDDKVRNSGLHIEGNSKLIIKTDEEIHRVHLSFEDSINEKLKTSELRFHSLELQINGKYLLLKLIKNSKAWSQI
jgi:hypothetical protein